MMLTDSSSSERLTSYEVSDDPKMLRETLCIAQSVLLSLPFSRDHVYRLQRLIDECDRHRPLGSDGKHGNLHTDTCGCTDKRVGCSWHEEGGYGYVWDCNRCQAINQEDKQ